MAVDPHRRKPQPKQQTKRPKETDELKDTELEGVSGGISIASAVVALSDIPTQATASPSTPAALGDGAAGSSTAPGGPRPPPPAPGA